MLTQADMAQAVGTPPDRVETPATGGFGHGDTDTHREVHTPPGKICENDIYQDDAGAFRTVALVQHYRLSGETALYFRHPHHGAHNRVKFPAGSPDVTVYRPREVKRDQ
jgi:hypothetical protein